MAEQIKNANVPTKTDSAQLIQYKVQGQLITLTTDIVRSQLTNNNRNITDGEIALFMQLCKYLGLNPFLREAYLIKYDNSKPAQQVVSLSALQRIADSNPNYDGIEDGIVVQKNDGSIVKRDGCILYNKELLIGGWATVYRKDRKISIKAQLSLKEYSKTQATWNSSPAMMINKCAKVAALRKAFPQNFGAAYIEEELGVDIQSQSQETMEDNADVVYDIGDCAVEEEIADEILQEPTMEDETTNNNMQQSESASDILEMPYGEYIKLKDEYEKVGYFERDGVKFAKVKRRN